MTDKQKYLFNQLLDEIDISYKLIYEYDQIPLMYGGMLFYQQETHTIQQIGKNPGITVSEIAENTGKTTSACSQIIKKLRERNVVIQKRNMSNCRQYNLELTDYGWEIFNEHEALDSACFENYEQQLQQFSEEQLNTAIMVQQKLNEAFQKDVKRSLEQRGIASCK